MNGLISGHTWSKVGKACGVVRRYAVYVAGKPPHIVIVWRLVKPALLLNYFSVLDSHNAGLTHAISVIVGGLKVECGEGGGHWVLRGGGESTLELGVCF